jgi:hypothetical protein
MADGRDLSYQEIQRAEGPWKPGMFYDVGGAAALYWPDQHPERREPAAMRWLVFDPWGGIETIVGRLPREDFFGREIGMVPFLNDVPAEDWTEQPRFADFREAYAYATNHFSMAIRAHAKVDRCDAYRIWHTIQLGMEKILRRKQQSAPPTRR